MAIERIIDTFLSREPACGGSRVLAIDGPSGSGKSDLATAISEKLSAPILHLDALHAGWRGLEAAPPMVERVLAAHSLDDVAEVTVWDWDDDRPGSRIQVPPTPLLIVEGVGAGAARIRPYLSCLVWMEAPALVRRRRALARDGATYLPWWDIWAAQELIHFGRERTRAAADLRITTG